MNISEQEDTEKFVKMTDHEWQKATKKIKDAVEKYKHIDFGNLAEEAIKTDTNSKK